MQILVIIEAIIFIVLSALHFYWALGGSWGFKNGLPTNNEGVKILNPTKKDSALVGTGLLLFAIFYLLKIDILSFILPTWVEASFGWIISGIFILRAIGDFRYVGFFKKIRQTTFGKNDTKYYAPLCAIIGLLAILIELNA